ncbi:MAG: phosphoribosylanthranilate isomerase [Phycisphaerales bacterium]|nr:phosphoribosylanthranilate isomerase [Phycisphaerales bacterium]
MPTIRIKICGVTTVDDARAVADLGADLIGLNLYDGPRKIDVPRASEILNQLPASITPVVLLDAAAGRIPRELIERHRITHLQLYGPVAPDLIRALSADGLRPIYVAAAVTAAFVSDVQRFLDACGDRPPAAILLDAVAPDRAGGTGRRADWDAIRHAREIGRTNGWPPIWLAGGLRPDNVTDAIRMVQPDVVDVSSGVESSPGRKDPSAVDAFVRAVREAQPAPRDTDGSAANVRD